MSFEEFMFFAQAEKNKRDKEKQKQLEQLKSQKKLAEKKKAAK